MNHIILWFNTMIVGFGSVESKHLVKKVLYFTHQAEMTTADLDVPKMYKITLARQHQKY